MSFRGQVSSSFINLSVPLGSAYSRSLPKKDVVRPLRGHVVFERLPCYYMGTSIQHLGPYISTAIFVWRVQTNESSSDPLRQKKSNTPERGVLRLILARPVITWDYG